MHKFLDALLNKECNFDNEKTDDLSGKNCKFCKQFYCIKHLQPELHNCLKTRYVKYIRKRWLRKMGQNLSSGHYRITCETCGYVSDIPMLIEVAGQELETHLQSKDCIENKIYLDQTDEDELDRTLGMPVSNPEPSLSWMYDCLEDAKSIITNNHNQNPTDTNYPDLKGFFGKKIFEIDIQKTRSDAYGYINLYEDFRSQNHYQIGIHEILADNTLENRRMVTVVLIHELLHALHPNLTHSEPNGINQLEKRLANLGLHFDALRNLEVLYLSGKMKLCNN